MAIAMRSNTRPPLVWAALSLQFVVVFLSAGGSIQLIPLLFRQPAWGAQLLMRELIFAAVAVTSLIGLWHRRKWGWGLSLAIDGVMCIQILWAVLNYSIYFRRHPGSLAFSVWQFAALVALLYTPVREHFLDQIQTDSR